MEPHLAHQTTFTRTGKLNMHNRKPYRTARQKAEAKQLAFKCADGTWRSNAAVSHHRAQNGHRAD